MKKIIDCFPFFNEKELLELRIKLLNDYVDKFIISELNYTHSGNKKEFVCRKIIEELNLPKDKIQIIELEIDEDEKLIPEDCDYVYSQSSQSSKVKNWTRERLQRDCMISYIDEYEEDTVFILSDCDEIINPDFINYFSECCRSYKHNVIKVPLVSLEGRADKRVYDGDNPLPWDKSLVLCTKYHLINGGSPTKFRGEYQNPFPPVWITQDNEIIQDCGWHFTWMGNSERRKIKSESTIHSDNLDVYDNLSSNSMEEIGAKNNKLSLKHYNIDLLPKVIFDNQRIKDFLLPDYFPSISKKVFDFYEVFDLKYGEWGWCFEEKVNKIIECVLETSSNNQDPVCVEVGVYGGKSLFPAALSLKEIGRGKIHGIDPWTNEEAVEGYDGPHYNFWSSIDLERIYNIFLDGIQQLNLQDYVIVHRTSSDECIEIKDINVLHIDGQHTDQIIRDINKYATNVVKGGYCFLDDVGWSGETLKSIELIESLGYEKVCELSGCFLYKRIKIIDNTFKLSITSNPTCWIVDNFYENPDQVRKFALEQEYVEGGFGRGFIGRRTENQFLFPGLKERFEEIIGQKITAWEEHGMNGRFQIAWSGEPLVYHCDSQKWGGMLYLTPNAPYQCGTTLYAHKQTRARTYYEEGWDAAWSRPGGSHLDGTPWEPVDVCGNVYNRLFIFDASCIHSASQYFGITKENARLWQMFFFDT